MNKIITTLSVFSLSLVFAGSAYAAIDISGNGAGSHNHTKLSTKVSSTLVQTNKSKFKNNVGVGAGTGDIKANKNTGGVVTVTTGDTTGIIDVTNTANVNTTGENLNSCCPCSVPVPDITITGNGANSHNDVTVKNKCTTTTVQSNDAYISNNVGINSETGDISANKNTGGDVSVTTGDANSSVTITNTANSNTL